eukprot:c24052_g1_i2 orf=328-1383(+)
MAHTYNFTLDDFSACCGSRKFAAEMVKAAPFSSLSQAVEASRSIWWNKVDIPGWLEAFSCHSWIGDVEALKNKHATSREWSKSEQSAALSSADDSILQELAEWNLQYELKFGFLFLICASGKNSTEILSALKTRFSNRPIDEIQVAASEQQKITELRLAKLFTDGYSTAKPSVELSTTSLEKLQHSSDQPTSQIESNRPGLDKDMLPQSLVSDTAQSTSKLQSPITTHVLDVSLGRPGAGIEVVLEVWKGLSTGDHSREWIGVGSSSTDSDGRCGPLMPASAHVKAGRYRLTFNTGDYFSKVIASSGGNNSPGIFYPCVSVVFEINPTQVFEHFHIPLLLSPFSYTTYRGS